MDNDILHTRSDANFQKFRANWQAIIDKYSQLADDNDDEICLNNLSITRDNGRLRSKSFVRRVIGKSKLAIERQDYRPGATSLSNDSAIGTSHSSDDLNLSPDVKSKRCGADINATFDMHTTFLVEGRDDEEGEKEPSDAETISSDSSWSSEDEFEMEHNNDSSMNDIEAKVSGMQSEFTTESVADVSKRSQPNGLSLLNRRQCDTPEVRQAFCKPNIFAESKFQRQPITKVRRITPLWCGKGASSEVQVASNEIQADSAVDRCSRPAKLNETFATGPVGQMCSKFIELTALDSSRSSKTTKDLVSIGDSNKPTIDEGSKVDLNISCRKPNSSVELYPTENGQIVLVQSLPDSFLAPNAVNTRLPSSTRSCNKLSENFSHHHYSLQSNNCSNTTQVNNSSVLDDDCCRIERTFGGGSCGPTASSPVCRILPKSADVTVSSGDCQTNGRAELNRQQPVNKETSIFPTECFERFEHRQPVHMQRDSKKLEDANTEQRCTTVNRNIPGRPLVHSMLNPSDSTRHLHAVSPDSATCTSQRGRFTNCHGSRYDNADQIQPKVSCANYIQDSEDLPAQLTSKVLQEKLSSSAFCSLASAEKPSWPVAAPIRKIVVDVNRNEMKESTSKERDNVAPNESLDGVVRNIPCDFLQLFDAYPCNARTGRPQFRRASTPEKDSTPLLNISFVSSIESGPNDAESVGGGNICDSAFASSTLAGLNSGSKVVQRAPFKTFSGNLAECSELAIDASHRATSTVPAGGSSSPAKRVAPKSIGPSSDSGMCVLEYPNNYQQSVCIDLNISREKKGNGHKVNSQRSRIVRAQLCKTSGTKRKWHDLSSSSESENHLDCTLTAECQSVEGTFQCERSPSHDKGCPSSASIAKSSDGIAGSSVCGICPCTKVFCFSCMA